MSRRETTRGRQALLAPPGGSVGSRPYREGYGKAGWLSHLHFGKPPWETCGEECVVVFRNFRSKTSVWGNVTRATLVWARVLCLEAKLALHSGTTTALGLRAEPGWSHKGFEKS